MKSSGMIAALMGSGILRPEDLEGLADKFKKPVKKCLQCSTEHTHNNSFCSADCYRKFKTTQPNKE